MSTVKVRGGRVLTSPNEDGGTDVTVEAPTAAMAGAQALVSGREAHAIIVPAERRPDLELRCVRCGGGDVVVEVHYTNDEGYAVRLCRTCILSRVPGHPIVVNIDKVG